jgi:hypothetical protein
MQTIAILTSEQRAATEYVTVTAQDAARAIDCALGELDGLVAQFGVELPQASSQPVVEVGAVSFDFAA